MTATPPISAPWTPAERAAWAPPPRLSVSKWADQNIVLSAKESAEPGPWRTSRTPPLRGPMDALGDPRVQFWVLVKPAQVGGSQITRIAHGYWCACDPGPALLVYPTEASAKEQVAERLAPMFRNSPTLSAMLTGERYDISDMGVSTVSMDIHIGWMGSPQAMASRPCRYGTIDEADKGPVYAGKDGSPVALIGARLRTYGHRSKLAMVSTPTTDKGAIWTAFESCEDRRRYHVPCPLCGEFQILTRDRFRWDGYPDDVPADQLEREGVWYECAHCSGRIEEREKDAMSERGEWRSEADEDGAIPENASRVGFQLSAFVCTIGVKWRSLIAKYMRVKGDPAKLFEFVTQDLGEPFRDLVKSVKDAALEDKKRSGNPKGVVPTWASHVVVTADTQKDYFFWLARAWGAGERSQLLDLGKAKTFRDLEAQLTRKYPIGATPETMQPTLMLIDAAGGTATDADGNRTDEVHRWAAGHAPYVIAVRGMGGNIDPQTAPDFRDGWHTYTRKGYSGYRVRQITINTQRMKDILAARINQDPAPGKPPIWELCDDTPPEYFDHLRAEHKIGIRKGQAWIERWVIRSHGRRNEGLDTEVYQICGGKLIGAEAAPEESELERERQQIQEGRAMLQSARTTTRRFGRGDGRPFLANRR